MPNPDPSHFELGLSLMLRQSPDYARAVEELYCASLAAGSDASSFTNALIEIGDRYGIEGTGRQLLLIDVVMQVVGTIRESTSSAALAQFEAEVAERGLVARLADDLENFEDGAL